MENKYFAELTRRLNEAGIPTGAFIESGACNCQHGGKQAPLFYFL